MDKTNQAKKLTREAEKAVQSDGTYSDAFRARCVERMLAKGGPSANQLSKETGVSQPTLSRWLRQEKSKQEERPTLHAVKAGEPQVIATKMGIVMLVPMDDMLQPGVLQDLLKAAEG